MTDQNITFPTQSVKLDTQMSIKTKKPLGLTAEVLIKEKARKLNLYNQPIQCDAVGKDELGRSIAVNSVGRWLFGVPGYKGNIRIVPEGENVVLHYPKESPSLVQDLLSNLKQEIEGANS